MIHDTEVPEIARRRIDHYVTELLVRAVDTVALARSLDESIEVSIRVGAHTLRLSIDSLTSKWQADGADALDVLSSDTAVSSDRLGTE